MIKDLIMAILGLPVCNGGLLSAPPLPDHIRAAAIAQAATGKGAQRIHDMTVVRLEEYGISVVLADEEMLG